MKRWKEEKRKVIETKQRKGNDTEWRSARGLTNKEKKRESRKMDVERKPREREVKRKWNEVTET